MRPNTYTHKLMRVLLRGQRGLTLDPLKVKTRGQTQDPLEEETPGRDPGPSGGGDPRGGTQDPLEEETPVEGPRTLWRRRPGDRLRTLWRRRSPGKIPGDRPGTFWRRPRGWTQEEETDPGPSGRGDPGTDPEPSISPPSPCPFLTQREQQRGTLRAFYAFREGLKQFWVLNKLFKMIQYIRKKSNSFNLTQYIKYMFSLF